MIRQAARLERRTISAFVLNAVTSRLQMHLRKPPAPQVPKDREGPQQV